MSWLTEDKYAIKQQAWLQAIRICGGVSAYSRRIKVLRSRVSNWVNQPELEIPYEYAVLTEELTQISIDRLSPFTKSSNEIIKALRFKAEPSLIWMTLNDILVDKADYLKHAHSNRPILIGTDSVLISGLSQLETHLALKIKKIEVRMIDLEALLLGQRTLDNLNFDLLISEKIAIGLRLEVLIGNRQGQRTDLINKTKKNNQLLPPWGEVKGRKDIWIAKLLGYSPNTYYRAKQVCLKGHLALTQAMDSKAISIAVAMKRLLKANLTMPG